MAMPSASEPLRHEVTGRKTTIECSLQLLSKPRIKGVCGHWYFCLHWLNAAQKRWAAQGAAQYVAVRAISSVQAAPAWRSRVPVVAGFLFSDRSRFRDFRDRDVSELDLFLPAAGLAVSRLQAAPSSSAPAEAPDLAWRAGHPPYQVLY